MAYLQQNPENTEEEKTGMNTLGDDTQGGQNISSQPQNVPSNASGASLQAGGQPAAQSGSQAQSQPSKRASSGMFTNIRKYIDANRGAGQKIGGAITKDLSKQASDVGKQVQRQKQKYESNIQQQRERMGTAGTQAEDILNRAMDTTAYAQKQTPITSAEEQQFRDLTTGKTQFANLDAINLANQQRQAKELEQRAKGLETFGGRTQALKDVFGRQRDYTRGQSALDAALLQKDLGGLVDQAGQIGRQTGEGVQSARQAALQSLAGFKGDEQSFQQRLQDLASGRVGEAESQLQSELAKLKEARLSDYETLQTKAQDFNQMIRDLGARSDRDIAEKIFETSMSGKWTMPRLTKALGMEGATKEQIRDKFINELISGNQELGKQYIDWGYSGGTRLFGDYLSPELLPLLKQNIKDQNLGNLDKPIDYWYNPASTGNPWKQLSAVMNYSRTLRDASKKLGNIYTVDRALQDVIGDTEAYKTGQDLTLEAIASPEQRARQAALERLAGDTDPFLQAKVGEDYLTPSEIAARQSDYLNRLNKMLSTTSGAIKKVYT